MRLVRGGSRPASYGSTSRRGRHRGDVSVTISMVASKETRRADGAAAEGAGGERGSAGGAVRPRIVRRDTSSNQRGARGGEPAGDGVTEPGGDGGEREQGGPVAIMGRARVGPPAFL